MSFYVTDDTDTIFVVKEDGSRFLFEVDSRQLHMCVGCVIIDSDGIMTKLIRWYV